MASLVGKDLGRYHLIEQLGEGGMASVYKAYDQRLDRYVAVKVIISGQQDKTEFLKRFSREAQALAKLQHTNIVKVYDYGDENGLPYLVMEYLPGGTLKSKMSGTPMPYQDAARLVAPIARALETSHQLDIIHRDVKPANILFNASGQPMLSDFGIAKMLSAGESTALTGMGVGIGTPEYMSPEQGQGLPIDARADIYALGVVFYELITGRKPFRADTPMAVIVKHMTEPLPRPRQYVPTLPEDVERVIFKALAKDANLRYQTMGEFASALENLTQKTVIPSKTTSPADERTMTSPRVAGVVPPAATVVSGAQAMPQQVAVPRPAVSQATVAQQAAVPQVAAPAAKKKGGISWGIGIAVALGAGLLLILCLTGGYFLFLKPKSTGTAISQGATEIATTVVSGETAPTETSAQPTSASNATSVPKSEATATPANTETPTVTDTPTITPTPGIPTNVPTEIPIIPDHGKITVTTVNDTSSKQQNVMIMYETGMSQADAIDFYKTNMTKNGWSVIQELDSNTDTSQSHMIMYQKGKDDTHTIMVNVTNEKNKTTVQVMDMTQQK